MLKPNFLSLIQYLNLYFRNSSNQDKIKLFIDKAKNENAWFSDSFIRKAIQAILEQFLDVNRWVEFFNKYSSPTLNVKKIGLVLPGNLPGVGLHDVLMTLASGHQAFVKLSSNDQSVMLLFIDAMREFDSQIPIQIVDRLQGVDAVIATGSDFSSGYFYQYFSSIPHIIRKNRTSVGILNGNEQSNDFKSLASDIFGYYGLGCRNVSTLAVPVGYDLIPLFDVLSQETWVLDHSKYSNNFQYHRTLFLLNQVDHFDLGNLLVTENDTLVSPVGVLYVYRYQNLSELSKWILLLNEKIQCIVGPPDFVNNAIDFGQSQNPGLSDFADGIDTFNFLIYLK